MLDRTLLDIIVCPNCKGQLSYQSAQPNGEDRLICTAEQLAYPVRDGLPVLLVDEAMSLQENLHAVDHSIQKS